jgi:hypothetical protein
MTNSFGHVCAQIDCYFDKFAVTCKPCKAATGTIGHRRGTIGHRREALVGMVTLVGMVGWSVAVF